MMFFPVVLVLGVALVLFGVALYNRLVRLRNTVRSSWSDIGVLLKKRYDLVENLVQTVKGYATHEKTTLLGVTEARGRAMQATSPADKAQAEGIFRETLKSLFAIAEAYPDLKANTNFLQLQNQLKEIEDQIEYSRRYYNAVVRDYNTLTESFPSNLVAGQFGFEKAEFFEPPSAEESRPPKVSF